MWRKAAVKTMLLEGLCSLSASHRADDRSSDGDRRLEKARRRAGLVIAFDWIALGILFFFRNRTPWLSLGPFEDSVFTIGVLAVAVHSGFRLGQLEKLRAVARLVDELNGRSAEE